MQDQSVAMVFCILPMFVYGIFFMGSAALPRSGRQKVYTLYFSYTIDLWSGRLGPSVRCML